MWPMIQEDCMSQRKNKLSIAWGLMMLMVVTLFLSMVSPMDAKADTNVKVKIHYQRQDMEGWNVWLWEEGKDGAQVAFEEQDDFGAVANVKLETEAKKLGFILRKGDFQEKDGEEDRFIEVKDGTAEVWLKEGDPKVYKANPDVETTIPSEEGGDILLKVHYRRFDENYDNWNLWLWPDGKEGEAIDFSNVDEFGAVLETTLSAENSNKYGFIIRKGDWEAKDVEEDRFISLDDAKDSVLEIYLVEKDTTIYYSLDEVDLSPKILKAELTGVNKMNLELSVPKTLLHDQDEQISVAYSEGEEVTINAIYFMEGGRPEKSSQFEILFEEPLDLGKDYVVSVEGYGEKIISLSGVFSTQAFENQYHYSGELGAIYEDNQTTFRLWSPVATNVELRLFTNGDGGEPVLIN